MHKHLFERCFIIMMKLCDIISFEKVIELKVEMESYDFFKYVDKSDRIDRIEEDEEYNITFFIVGRRDVEGKTRFVCSLDDGGEISRDIEDNKDIVWFLSKVALRTSSYWRWKKDFQYGDICACNVLVKETKRLIDKLIIDFYREAKQLELYHEYKCSVKFSTKKEGIKIISKEVRSIV